MPRENILRRPSLRVIERASDWLSLPDFEAEAADWIRAGRRVGHSEGTLTCREQITRRLLAFLRAEGCARCGPEEVEAFFDHLLEQKGRTGKPLKSSTLATYHGYLTSFFKWLVASQMLSESPMARLPRPRVPEDQIRPFSGEQLERLRTAARAERDPVRDEALLLLLYDTGIRVSELCALNLGDVDLTNRRCRVFGKGGKYRTVSFGGEAYRAVRKLSSQYRDPKQPDIAAGDAQPLFCSNSGRHTGERITRSGVHGIIRRLGKRAGITGVRCSPHTLRHTFAVEYLRNDGPVFSLQTQLGHASLGTTKKYVNLAEADLDQHHAKASPADNLFRKRRR